MRQQEHQQLNEMDNNDRKRGETTSLDAAHQHKAAVKGRCNNDPLPLPPINNESHLKVSGLQSRDSALLYLSAGYLVIFWRSAIRKSRPGVIYIS